jgi:superfamily II DNA/RNA helicase
LALRALIGQDEVRNGIVFCNRKTEVDIVAKSLRSHGFDASPIHGDLDQSMRMRTLEAFRKGELKLLVASDVAARGLDIPDVSHVFNYDVPHHADDYVHRIGRTGRAGRSGATYMLVTPADGRSLDKVLKLTGKTPEQVTLDIDYSGVRSDARRERPRRPSERERERGRGRPASETSVAPMEPFKADAPRPETEFDTADSAASLAAATALGAKPSQRRGASHSHDANPRPSRPRDRHVEDHRGPRARGEGAPETVVIGFGADLPAFLARPIPVAKG